MILLGHIVSTGNIHLILKRFLQLKPFHHPDKERCKTSIGSSILLLILCLKICKNSTSFDKVMRNKTPCDIKWTKRQADALKKLKKTEAPDSVAQNFQTSFIVFTNASNLAIATCFA